MTAHLIILVALAGGAGAACRYVLDYTITQRMRGVVPWGTWTVNVTGSLGLGLLTGLTLRFSVPTEVMLIIGGGFLGAYTTFSTWMYESLRLIEEGAWRMAVVNLVGSTISGGGTAAIGLGVILWMLAA